MQEERREGDRRQSKGDLEVGQKHLPEIKQQLVELLDQVLPLIQMDEAKNEQAKKLIEDVELIKRDIKNTDDALSLKEACERAEAALGEISGIKSRVGDRRAVNEANAMHQKLILIERGLSLKDK